MNPRHAALFAAFAFVASAANATEPNAPQRVRIDISAKPWAAVGQVNNEAYGRCTGVLIAPQLAVTAAHCIYNKRTQRFLRPQSIHFVLGYDRGTYRFGTVAAAVRMDPAYDGAHPMQSLSRDWALLELAEPAPAAVQPIELAPSDPKPGDIFVSAGFGRDRAYALTAAEACPFIPGAPSGLVAAECSIVKGYSGGPMVDAAGRLVGIQVAAGRFGTADVAFAVRASTWATAPR